MCIYCILTPRRGEINIKIGKSLKKLRIAKGITVKETCGNTINKGNYWRIEKDIVVPKVDTFLMILENMNVSIRDFLEIHDISLNELDKLIPSLKEAFENKNTTYLNEIITHYDRKYSDTKKNTYEHIAALASIFKSRLEEQAYDPVRANILKEYLFKCENWTYYEVRMLNNTLFLYDEFLMLIFYKRSMKFLNSTKQKGSLDNLKMKMSQNIIMYSIDCHKPKVTVEAFEIMSSLILEENSAYAKIIKMWLTGIYKYDKSGKGISEIMSALKTLKILGMSNQLNLHISWTKKVLKEEDHNFLEKF